MPICNNIGIFFSECENKDDLETNDTHGRAKCVFGSCILTKDQKPKHRYLDSETSSE